METVCLINKTKGGGLNTRNGTIYCSGSYLTWLLYCLVIITSFSTSSDKQCALCVLYSQGMDTF